MAINGSTIQRRRKTLGLSQRQLAVYADVSLATVKRAEKDKHDLKVDTAERLARALGVTVDDLRGERVAA